MTARTLRTARSSWCLEASVPGPEGGESTRPDPAIYPSGIGRAESICGFLSYTG
jgi:hypothetical protein